MLLVSLLVSLLVLVNGGVVVVGVVGVVGGVVGVVGGVVVGSCHCWLLLVLVGVVTFVMVVTVVGTC